MIAKKLLISISLLSFIVSTVAWADFDIAVWQYEKAINVDPQLTSPTYVELTFDGEVFSHASSGLRDLRIIDSAGDEVPYKVFLERGSLERESYPVQIINNSFVPGEYTFLIAYLGEGGAIHNHLTLITPSVNFRQEVTIEGSNDQEQWFTLTDTGHIYDYSPPKFEFKKHVTTIAYPESTFKYLRVTIFNRGENRVVVSRAEAYRTVKTLAKEATYPLAIIERGEDQEKRTSFAVLDLGSSGLPSNRLLLSIPEVNFSRDVALEGSNDKENWKVVEFRDVIFSFVTPKFTGSKFEITYPESNYRYYRLTVFNRDDKPITIAGAQASGLLRKLIFEYDPQKEYKLYYGNSHARYPQYDIEALFPYLDIAALPKASLSAETSNLGFQVPLPRDVPLTERLPWLLPSILGIVVLALGGLITKLVLSAKRSARTK